MADALAACDRSAELAEECVATVVRAHPDALVERCAALPSIRWRSECAFGIAEARAKEGDRWGALVGCGAAGAYYNECLYHAWTFELQLHAEGLGRAVDGIEAARPIVAFWAQIETIGPGAEDLLWSDWWYFAHMRNRPASLASCATLPDPTDRGRCEAGTRTYVRRNVVETLLRPSTGATEKDRLCRGDSADALAVLGEIYLPHPELDAELDTARAAGCATGRVERPWNPVFRARILPHG